MMVWCYEWLGRGRGCGSIGVVGVCAYWYWCGVKVVDGVGIGDGGCRVVYRLCRGRDIDEVFGVVIVSEEWGGVTWVGLGWIVGEGDIASVTRVTILWIVHGCGVEVSVHSTWHRWRLLWRWL
jgi:hypothetical protein